MRYSVAMTSYKSNRPPPKTAALPAECKICRYQFSTGILGWDKHIGAIEKHPNWHPELTAPAERQAQYAAEFPDFFKDALTKDRRLAPQARATTPPGGTRAASSGLYSGVTPTTNPRLALLPEVGTPPAAEARCPTCGGPAALHYRSTVG